MKIVLTGGGSGGHITPILAVASELKKLRPQAQLIYIGQTGDKLADIPAQHSAIDAAYTVRAGKFRRYHGEGWRQVFDLGTQAKNLRDGFRVLAGLWQSYWLIRGLKPQIVFSRGGFVSVPVCLGAALNHVPYVTHDSDSVPSLANRLIARWATLHAVALPEGLYPYPRRKTVMVGVPVGQEYVAVTTKLQHKYREELAISQYPQVILVTGGGNGAEQLNRVVAMSVPALLQRFPRLCVLHVAGRGLATDLAHHYDKIVGEKYRAQVIVKDFISDLYRYSGAADLIVARGGANTLAEFAIQGKACIIIPATQLVGGHQLKNAQAFADQRAIRVVSMADSERDGYLAQQITLLLNDSRQRQALAKTLSVLARPAAAHDLAMVLLEQIDHSG